MQGVSNGKNYILTLDFTSTGHLESQITSRRATSDLRTFYF